MKTYNSYASNGRKTPKTSYAQHFLHASQNLHSTGDLIPNRFSKGVVRVVKQPKEVVEKLVGLAYVVNGKPVYKEFLTVKEAIDHLNSIKADHYTLVVDGKCIAKG